MNQTFLTWTGYRRDEVVGRRFVELLSPGGRIYHETHFTPLLQMQGSVRSIATELVRRDASRMPVLVNADLRADEAGRPVSVRTTVFDASDRKQYETELLAARRRAEQAADWVSAIEQVVADLAAVSGAAEVSDVVARAGTSVFGAVSSGVWAADEPDDEYHLVATAGEPWAADHPVGELLVAEASVVPDSLVVRVALTARAGRLGVLSLRLPPGRRPGPEELRLLQTLGRQAGQALDRARFGDRQRSVATTLQHSLLPKRLPDDPRVELSSCYRPAILGLEVGGDWFDAFLLDGDRVAVVVGDVVGRGLHAAVAMGQLRSAVRALATADAGPAVLLERLDLFVAGVPAADMATVAYAELDLRDGTLRYACAGHLPPVVVGPDGRSDQLWGGRSTPLGTYGGLAPRSEAATTLEPGARLVLYTDGLVERRDRPLDEGIDALAALLGSLAGQPHATLADELTETVLGTGPTGDDVCVLTLAYLPVR